MKGNKCSKESTEVRRRIEIRKGPFENSNSGRCDAGARVCLRDSPSAHVSVADASRT